MKLYTYTLDLTKPSPVVVTVNKGDAFKLKANIKDTPDGTKWTVQYFDEAGTQITAEEQTLDLIGADKSIYVTAVGASGPKTNQTISKAFKMTISAKDSVMTELSSGGGGSVEIPLNLSCVSLSCLPYEGRVVSIGQETYFNLCLNDVDEGRKTTISPFNVALYSNGNEAATYGCDSDLRVPVIYYWNLNEEYKQLRPITITIDGTNYIVMGCQA